MKKIIVALILFYSSNLNAQNPDWIYLTKAESINTLAEDGNYIWAGSIIGATKIDKNTGNKTYFDKTNCPLTDSWVSEIAVDKHGTKWFGTWIKGSLVKFDDVNWTVYDSSNSPLPGHAIDGLAVDSSNNIWIMTGWTTDGLMKFDGTNWTAYNTSNSGLPSNYVTAIFCEGNTIWAGTNAGLAKFDGVNWIVYDTSNSTISESYIGAIDKDTNGNIWLLHYNGVEKFDGITFTVFNELNTNIQNVNNYSMCIDADNIIWTGCASYDAGPTVLGGIMSFDGTTWTKYDTTNSPIADVSIYPVYADNSNTVWFGCSNTAMLGRINGSDWTNYDPSKSGLISNYVRQIVFDQHGNTFIGSHNLHSSGNGLVKYDWNTWSELPNYNYATLRMATDPSGNLYIKNRTGMQKFDGINWSEIPGMPPLLSAYPVSLSLNTLATSLPGELWIDYLDRVVSVVDTIFWTTTYFPHEGLAHYNGSSWTTFSNLNSPLPDANINDIQIDADNHTWIATDSGLVKYDGINWTVFNTSNSSLPTNYIRSFTIDTSGNIWFSNGQHGLYKFDLTNTSNYPHPTLNPYASWGVIAADIDGSVWQIAGSNLIRFDGTNWTTFTTDNSPIPNFGNLISLSIDKFGNKWLGTQFGVLVYRQGGVITSAPSEPFQALSLSVYPNPFKDVFKMDFGRQLKDVEVTLFDLLSRPVYSSSHARAQKIRITRNNLSPGIYYYQLKSCNKIISSGKIIAE